LGRGLGGKSFITLTGDVAATRYAVETAKGAEETQGMVARLNRKRNEMLDEHGHTNGLLTRPILFLNVTAEFAPGSSGAPVVDEAGNVVAQVASIADAGEPPVGNTNAPPSPSVPIRFCTAAEEILRLTGLDSRTSKAEAGSNAPIVRPKPRPPH